MSAKNDNQLLAHACGGELEELGELAPLEAYFWLSVAHDHGHEEAIDEIYDLIEHHNVFKHDDSGTSEMEIRMELMQAYLKGERGLQSDLKLAKHYAELIIDEAPQGLAVLETLLPAVDDTGRAMLDECRGTSPFRAVRRFADRIERLTALNRQGAEVPTVISDAECDALRTATEEAIASLKASRD